MIIGHCEKKKKKKKKKETDHSQAGLVSKLLKQIAKAWKAERGYR
jgi:transcriptional/translational regulatory protein YebC/TACO1